MIPSLLDHLHLYKDYKEQTFWINGHTICIVAYPNKILDTLPGTYIVFKLGSTKYSNFLPYKPTST